ncbi:MAG: uracil-DNA glycosylase [Acidobacteria bacterium]|nr:uracil-DNA glycosylase [Acidobacteriota bacterium]
MNKFEQIEELRELAIQCPPCPNRKTRLQVVFGEGNPDAEIMIVGQGPGKVEEEEGRPFVGPAGMLLDRALEKVGLKREELWITNIIKCRATKVENGKVKDRPPSAAEKRACRPWLEGELDIVDPNIIICVGAPAAQDVIDKKFKITQERGQWREGPRGTRAIATLHPVYILRLRSVDEEAYQRAWESLVEDLRKVAEAVREA